VVPGTWALDDARRRLFFLAARPLLYRSRYGVVIPAALLDGRGAGKGSGTARDETLTLFTGDPPDANVTPRLENLAVRLAPYDPVTRRMGDLLLDQLDRKPFLEFGAVVRGFQGENKVLPEFTFTRVDPSAVLVSPIDGVVTSIDDQGDGDVELWLRPSRNSDWLVYLDHVKDVMVRVGDPVTAGQPLCKTAGAFELNVMYDRTGAEKVVAPFVHFDPALSDAYQGLIWAVMEKAEELSGQGDWYDEAAMRGLCAGCRALELKPY
jgi:hypothetical protein